MRFDVVDVQRKDGSSMQERLGRARVVVVRRLKGRGVFAEDLLHGPELGAVARQSKRKNATGPDEVVSGRCVDGSAEKKVEHTGSRALPTKAPERTGSSPEGDRSGRKSSSLSCELGEPVQSPRQHPGLRTNCHHCGRPQQPRTVARTALVAFAGQPPSLSKAQISAVPVGLVY